MLVSSIGKKSNLWGQGEMKFRLASATAVTILSVLGISPFHLV